jgi:O-antigen ligase
VSRAVRCASLGRTIPRTLILAAVMALAFLLGQRASVLWLALLASGIGGVVLLLRPVLGLPALVLAALILPMEIGTGTQVTLNPAALLVPVLAVLWLVDAMHRRRVRLVASAANLPLALFLAAGPLSLLIGRAAWHPLVPVGRSFLLVQLAQWAIFAFSALAFWLAGNLVRDELWLRRLTATFLVVAGAVAIARLSPGVSGLAGRFTTIAFIRAPLWALLVGLAGGQLLFNQKLSTAARMFLGAAVLASFVYAFIQQQDATSNWVGVGAALGTLVWLRFRRLRWPLLVAVVALILIGGLFPAVYNFAGGDEAWVATGASRLALIDRVVSVTMRNPITGLGPAAYRPYANMTPLQYQHTYWVRPMVSSHNNYVDLFAHGGLLGLALFGWLVAAITRTGLQVRARYTTGFAAGYANGVLATGAAALVLMVFADWILPFVYNIGFPGFQASVLVWLFMGGLVALEQMGRGGDVTR